jgi:putative hydrolase of HD superfamily
MKDRLKSTMRFYMLATQLKYKIRSGWDQNHWNVNKERIESVAEHVYGTCILAFGIYSELEPDININKVIKMLVLHEIGEVVIGDITPFDNVTPEEKMEREHAAIRNVLGDLIRAEEYYELLLEFDERKTKEAKFAYHCDKLEADIQAKVYLDTGCHRPLDQLPNNVVLKDPKIQELKAQGSRNAFDFFYEFDRPRYEDDDVFSDILDYIKMTNLAQNFKY